MGMIEEWNNDYENDDGFTILELCIQHDRWNLAEKILNIKKENKFHKKKDYKYKALSLICKESKLTWLPMILNSMDFTDRQVSEAFKILIAKGKPQMMKALLDCGNEAERKQVIVAVREDFTTLFPTLLKKI